jgi:AraC family transcriptional regulator
MADGSGTLDRIAGDSSDSRIAEWLRLRDPAKLSVRGLSKGNLVVTEVRYDFANYGMSDPVIPQDAFAVGLQLRDYPLHELWSDGRTHPVRNVRAGDTLLCDLRSVNGVHTAVPFHSLQFFLSRTFLDELAEGFQAPRIDELVTHPGQAVRDPVIAKLSRLAWPALARPHEVNDLYSSHCMLALGVHVCVAYAGLRPSRRHVGGLNRAQERIAKDLIASQLDGAFTVRELAAFCGLSPSHFAHAFKASVGLAPHQWLMQRRVERAKTLLADSSKPPSEIAQECGFADQSHFTRVFRREVGATPGAWRRSRC